MIHQTSIISKYAKIHDKVKIGPFCIIDDDVEIDQGNELISNVHITGNSKIGKNNKFFPFSTIGTIPQDKKFEGEKSKLEIGNNNIIREHVTINPGTLSGGMITKIESNCLIMIGSHIAHDCHISSEVILVNNATLGGHVNIGKGSIVGGNSAIHRFVNIGEYAMIGGMSGVESNIIPYGLYTGIRGKLRGLNLVGLKRQGLKSLEINNINIVFKKIFSKDNTVEKNIKDLKKIEREIEHITKIIHFIELNMKRGICKYSNE